MIVSCHMQKVALEENRSLVAGFQRRQRWSPRCEEIYKRTSRSVCGIVASFCLVLARVSTTLILSIAEAAFHVVGPTARNDLALMFVHGGLDYWVAWITGDDLLLSQNITGSCKETIWPLCLSIVACIRGDALL
uniref:Uncharacterized protein n=1 Tax=Romanomermis culicivorax TaxID=13658 RepID=A0A915L3C8_ROMCU